MNITAPARFLVLLATLLLVWPAVVHAQIKVGITISSTGAASAIGIVQRNTVPLLPTDIGGQAVEYIVLDDGSDAATAVNNMRKLIVEDNVDVVIGTSLSSGSLSMVDIAGETRTPMISLAASEEIVTPVQGPREWVFKAAPDVLLMTGGLLETMKQQGVKTLGYLGEYGDYGDIWLDALRQSVQAQGIKIVAAERFDSAMLNTAKQAHAVQQTDPDAIVIAAIGVSAVSPQQELNRNGYKGIVYQTYGAASHEVLQACGVACNGTIVSAGPLWVAGQLADDHPVRQSALDYKTRYEKQYGSGTLSGFGGHMWDAGLLIADAVPKALQVGAKPGTPDFRQALRTALEQVNELPVSHGVVTNSPTDHTGFDTRAQVMIQAADGQWIYQPDF